MEEALTAILAVPPAIESCKNLLTALRGALSHEQHKDQTINALNSVKEIQSAMYSFTSFTESLRKWKEVHYTTQLILYNDIPETLSMIRKGKEYFVKSAASRQSTVRQEFRQLNRGITGAIVHIDTMKVEDFDIDPIPEGAMLQPGRHWGANIKDLSQKSAEAFEKHDIGAAYTMLLKFERLCNVLNIAADKRLKDGLDDITVVMFKLRSKTQESV